MRQYGKRLAVLAAAAMCGCIFCACTGTKATGKEEKDQKVEIIHAKTSMEYYTAVSELVKEADTMNISGNGGKYENARLLVKGDKDLDFSAYEGVYKVISDPEGHYTVQFISSKLAEKASEELDQLETVEYAEPDGKMSSGSD